jgi:hypothetical protein
MLVGDTTGIGEWGFAALVDVDGHRMLVDTGAHPDTVIRNARDLHLFGCRPFALTLLGVQRKLGKVVLLHGKAKFTFDEGLNEQGEEVEGE